MKGTVSQSGSIQDQFTKVSTYEKEIQISYKELWAFSNSMFENSKFKDYIMEGLIRKNVRQVNLFTQNFFPKRYFIIDFKEAYISIKKNRDAPILDKSKSILLFRKILKCRLLNPGEQEGFTKNKLFQFAFVVKT